MDYIREFLTVKCFRLDGDAKNFLCYLIMIPWVVLFLVLLCLSVTWLIIYISYPTEKRETNEQKDEQKSMEPREPRGPREPREPREPVTTFSGSGTSCKVVVNDRDYPCNINIQEVKRNGTCKRIINGVEGPCD